MKIGLSMVRSDHRDNLRHFPIDMHCGKRWQHSGCQSLLYRRRLQRLRQHFQSILERAATTQGDTRTDLTPCRKLLRDSPRLWSFLKYQGVPMTNHAAEQSLRPYVIWRKNQLLHTIASGQSVSADDVFPDRDVQAPQGQCLSQALRTICR
ncbi:transposase [Methylomicrobium lacus]|uniref:IS66 family transposase n=1 Tax=Methylomicrobium lacus TaxID=136992 RepID=UPI0035A9959C